MPIYEYQCQICKAVQENVLSFSQMDTHVEKCVTCVAPMTRIVSVPARAVFNGPGFYETDYARKSNVVESQNRQLSDATKELKANPNKYQSREQRAKAGEK